MAGVPVLCSDACGSAVAVRASGMGGVFPAGDVRALQVLLKQVIDRGPINVEQRACLSKWAGCFASGAGADYLEDILAAVYSGTAIPMAPWQAPMLSDRKHRLALPGAGQIKT